MMFGKHKWFVSVLAAVCVAVQALVIVPHHHHGEAEAPCFNVVHCTAHDTSHDAEDACHDHCAPERQSGAGHDCSLKIDVAQVAAGSVWRAVTVEISLVNDLFVPAASPAQEQSGILHSFTLTRRRQQPPAVDKYALFIAEAHSARAPSQV